ncbi:hypothetical protein NM680_18075 [Paracoccus sp. PS-1]|uniref:hypothetical protein n=1 Tax=unclassified Paracoccus (in: a-proteobacteria) TaxID=2688777 RepID=UPI0004ADEAD8|nr:MULTISPECIES: hypothetical protein [unclassified Paracoccus (in: a-proteobacteria)]MDQ7263709.1 hypothetical protein [Paracoccus sp. PS1]UFM63346.1 hypothetical protein LOS78_04055 [Paracoccus sp. MA]
MASPAGYHAAARDRTDRPPGRPKGGIAMNSIIYLVGLVVVVLFILGLLGLR